jgi:hypothetical protein
MNDTPHRRMRSASVVIGVTALAAAALTGCSSGQDVCVDEDTMERVSDDYCEDDGGYSYGNSYGWYHVSGNQRVPSVGSTVYGGGSSSNYGGSTDYGGFGGSTGGISS